MTPDVEKLYGMAKLDHAVEFDVKYEAGHTYHELWDPCEFFCPGCGKKEVWREAGSGDYYTGEMYLCRSCGGKFHLPDGVWIDDRKRDWQQQQRLEAIRGKD